MDGIATIASKVVEPILICADKEPVRIALQVADMIRGGYPQVCFHNSPASEEKNMKVFAFLTTVFEDKVLTTETPDGFRVRPLP